MARNVEIKARVRDAAALRERAAAIADTGPTVIMQDDTFFACASGRLKLRDSGDGTGELIAYRRADDAGPKVSTYLRVPTDAPVLLRDALAFAHGEAGRVRKVRTLFLRGRTRIHLDRVEHLGDWIELEVVLGDDEPHEAGVHEARALMAELGVDSADCVEGAYVDLLRRVGGA